jgi:glycosyltransferase involved in cell wall biosynthesis
MISRRRRQRSDAASPLLSVVVPAYNVEDYLSDSLRSILGQSHTQLEVVVVDDGSTDTTGEIADQIAAEDARVRVLHQPNAGLGAARNEGVRHSTGTYLAFADSDDLVADGAYAALLGSLERTDSDLSIGAVERLRGDDRFMTPLMRENHRRTRLAVGIDEAPLVLADVFAWNKVFRRSFWDSADLAFPEDVRYEDQPAMTRALVAAQGIDILTEPVYLWRVRSDGSSISQQRDDLRDLSDRLLTKRWSTETVRASTTASTQEVWFGRVLPIDMWEYFRAVPACSDEYWELLRAGTTEFWNPATVPFERTSLPLRQRLMGWLVCQGRRSDLATLIDFVDQHPEGLPRRRIGNREVVEHPFAELPDLPPELLTP